jgi:hypothetical protein
VQRLARREHRLEERMSVVLSDGTFARPQFRHALERARPLAPRERVGVESQQSDQPEGHAAHGHHAADRDHARGQLAAFALDPLAQQTLQLRAGNHRQVAGQLGVLREPGQRRGQARTLTLERTVAGGSVQRVETRQQLAQPLGTGQLARQQLAQAAELAEQVEQPPERGGPLPFGQRQGREPRELERALAVRVAQQQPARGALEGAVEIGARAEREPLGAVQAPAHAGLAQPFGACLELVVLELESRPQLGPRGEPEHLGKRGAPRTRAQQPEELVQQSSG